MAGPAASTTPPKKRGAGRPVAGGNDVGRERLLVAAEKLLRAMPPGRVSMSRVAREADVDPALVRYYFGNRTNLLVAVVERVTGYTVHDGPLADPPAVALADHIGKAVRLVRSAPFMHRLMIDELGQAEGEETRARVKAMNLDLVNFYRELLRVDGGREFVATDPLLLHIAILGASDFLSSAEPLIRELLPRDADMEKLSADFQAFLAGLVLDGLRKR